MSRAVFLDRDGVLNEALVREGKPYPPAGLHELKILPGVPKALKKLRQEGFLNLVVTNQPDVARGHLTREAVESIHAKLAKELPLDGFYVCWHDDQDHCACRKPKPGLLRQAAQEHGLNLSRCFLIGDRWRDVEAGKAAGCRTVWVDCGYLEKKPSPPDWKCHNLTEAMEWIMKTREPT